MSTYLLMISSKLAHYYEGLQDIGMMVRVSKGKVELSREKSNALPYTLV